ncbi:MAG TPA: YbaB/EbfC family nucleoid-associated protein [Gammaproteobacteria bacterium]|nr:YbaB/EbfC family nucleoid-associated protein [Gammaproteobacteria bacterium]
MMKGGLGNLMKQAQAMQENLKKAQEELASIEVEGQSGGGMVRVRVSCRHDVHSVSIDNALLTDDKEVLEDLLAAAMNDATRKIEQVSKDKLGGLASGLNIPGLTLPF